MKLLYVAMLVVLCGCAGRKPIGQGPEWSELDWSPEAPSLVPVTNAVPNRTFK